MHELEELRAPGISTKWRDLILDIRVTCFCLLIYLILFKMQSFQKPENALKRANELLSIGQQEAALRILHSAIGHRRFRCIYTSISSAFFRLFSLYSLSHPSTSPKLAAAAAGIPRGCCCCCCCMRCCCSPSCSNRNSFS